MRVGLCSWCGTPGRTWCASGRERSAASAKAAVAQRQALNCGEGGTQGGGVGEAAAAAAAGK
eukprot:6211150-Pleurochrysis_carterae.AAC.2